MDAGVIVMIIVLLFSVVFHEVAHGWVAYMLGDKTAYRMGRLTLNPVPHIDPIWTIMVPLMLGFMSNWQFMFGGAKPVPVNPFNFNRPKRDMAITAAAGPLSNLVLIIITIILYKVLTVTGTVEGIEIYFSGSSMYASRDINAVDTFFIFCVTINSVLMVFNLIPIPPLDGSKILMGFLPYRQAEKYESLSRYGMLILIGILLIGNFTRFSVFDILIYPVINFFLGLLLG